MADAISLSYGLAQSSYQAGRRKGEVDSLMVALAGVVLLAILALIFVMVVGTSLDSAKDMICEKLADDAGAAGTVVKVTTKTFGCG